jgi:hypothetical protein
MKVHVYDYIAQHEVLRGTADLAEALPDPVQRAHAERYLRTVGRYWVEGGAAPLILLSLVEATR